MTTRPITLKATALAASAALMLSACGGGNGDDPDGNGDDGSNGGSDGPDVALAGQELNFSYMCIEDPDDPSVLIFSAIGTDVDSFGADFDSDGQSIGVEVDDVYWEASDSMGEIISADVDPENKSASGEATFENSDGDTEDGTFNLSCD